MPGDVTDSPSATFTVGGFSTNTYTGVAISRETLIIDAPDIVEQRVALDITQFIRSEGPDYGDAEIEAYLSDGQVGQRIADFRLPNRTITIPLLLLDNRGGLTYQQLRRQLQTKVALLQREGGWLKRQTLTATVYAEIVYASISYGGSGTAALFKADADATLTLVTLPEWLGPEEVIANTSGTSELVVTTSAGAIKGDMPGRLRLNVRDTARQLSSGLIWGIRARNYDAAATAALVYEAEAMTPLDTAATSSTLASTASGASALAHLNLGTTWTPVMSTDLLSGGPLTHVGDYRVWARVSTPNSTDWGAVRMRLAWDVGDLLLPVINDPVRISPGGSFYTIDLGVVRIPMASMGVHRWRGVIQAAGDTGGEDLHIDKLWLQPLDDGAGKLVAPATSDPGLTSFTVRDSFKSYTGTPQVGGAWSIAIACTGNTWSSSGAGSLQYTNAVGNANPSVLTTASPAHGAMVSQVDIAQAGGSVFNAGGGLVHYATSTQWLMLFLSQGGYLQVSEWISGVLQPLKTIGSAPAPGVDITDGAWNRLRLMTDARGYIYAWAFSASRDNAPDPIWIGYSPRWAANYSTLTKTAGLVSQDADGQPVGGTRTRLFRNFAAWTPQQDAVLFPSRRATARWDGAYREVASGVNYGPVSVIEGDLPRIPPSGLEQRAVQIFVKPSDGDFDSMPEISRASTFSGSFSYRPAYLILDS